MVQNHNLNTLLTLFRDAWKHFEGFPVKSAQMAYVFLVNQESQENRLKDQSHNNSDDEKLSAEEKAMSVCVSSFAAPLK